MSDIFPYATYAHWQENNDINKFTRTIRFRSFWGILTFLWNSVPLCCQIFNEMTKWQHLRYILSVLLLKLSEHSKRDCNVFWGSFNNTMQSKEEERRETLCWLHLVQADRGEMERKRETELIPTHLKAVITSLSAWWMIRSFYNEWIEILKGEREWNWLAYCTQNNSHYGSIIAENIPADYIERICSVFSWVTHWST